FAGRSVGHIASDGDAFELGRDLGRGFLVDVDDRDFSAGRGQRARGGGAEAGRAAGDDGRLALEVHSISFFGAEARFVRYRYLTLPVGGRKYEVKNREV